MWRWTTRESSTGGAFAVHAALRPRVWLLRSVSRYANKQLIQILFDVGKPFNGCLFADASG